MKKRSLMRCCVVLTAAIAAVGCLCTSTASLSGAKLTSCSDVQSLEEGETPMTGLELTADMKIGWNLGNTFDAPDGETSWGNPMTSEALLQKVKDLGFETIRIPISWGRHVSAAPEYTIDEAFLKRVDTVVNQALDIGFYVIINSHHDNGIYMPTAENSQRGQEYLHAIWTQIGEHFKDAGDHLIFQTMNEPRVEGSSYEWAIDTGNDDCLASLRVINELNQTALDAIRATGGNNADRFVIISPYAGNVGAAMSSYFQLPEDSVEDRLIVSIHAYTPYNLCLDRHSNVSEFTVAHEKEISGFLKSVNYRFIRKGIPVVIDEMGCLNKNNPEARYAWAKTYVSLAAEYEIPCVWWDNGAITSSGENFGLMNRRKVEVYPQSQTVYQGLMDGLVSED